MRPLGFLLLLLICAAPLLAQPQILYYMFNETSGAIAKNSAVPGQGYDNAIFSAAPNWNTTDPVLGAAAVDNTGLQRRLSTGYSMAERNGQDYTIEFFFRTTGTGYQDLVNDSDTFAIWVFNGRIQVYMNGAVRVQSTTTDHNNGTWRYCALRRQGGTTTLFWGGTGGGLTSATTNYNMTFTNRALELLHWQGAPPAGNFDGQMDEFRLWSVARGNGQLNTNRSVEQSVGDMEVFDSNGAFINHTSTTRYTRVDGTAFTDYTFSVLNTRNGGAITFTPVTFGGAVGVTAAVVTNPTTISPGQTTDLTIRLTPTAPEFTVTVNINNDRSPNPYQFAIEGLIDTGLPEMLYYRFNAGSGTQAANDASPGRGSSPATFTTGPAWNSVDPRLPGAAVASNANLATGFMATELPKVDFTVEFWMRTTASTGTVAMFGDGVSFSAFLDSGALRVRGGVQVLAIPGVYNDGNWHHVAIVSDPGNYGIRVYRDGVQVFQQVNFSFPFSSTLLTVMSNGGTQNFNGQLDEFRFWAYARSATQIADDMNHELFGRLDVQRPAATSIASGATDNVGSISAGTPLVMDYALVNVGGRDLTLGSPAVGFLGASNCNVVITTNPNGVLIGATLTTAAQVEVTPLAPGAFSVQLRFHSNDPDIDPYVVNVTGNATGTPVIQLERPVSTAIAHNGSDNVTGLGPVAGMALNYSYTIRNTGTVTLNLTGQSFSAASNCAVSVGAPGSATVAPGGTTTLPVTVTPGVGGGAFSFIVHVTSDAPAIPTYNVSVSGTAAPGGAMQITRGGPAFANPGADTASGTVAGQLTNLSYTLTNVGTGTLSSIAAALQGAPTNCSVNVGTPGATSLLITQSTGLTVGVTPGIAGGAFSFTLRVTSDDTVNGTFDIVVSGTAAPGGQTQVERLAVIPHTGTDSISGAVAGVLTSLTYTIRNTGSGTLSAITTSATGTPVNVFGGVFAPGASSLVPAATTTFNVNLTPTAAGAFSIAVRVSSNDPFVPNYDFTISGTAAPGGAMQITRGGPAFANPGNDTVGGAIAGQLTNLNYTMTNVGTGTLSSIAAAQFGAATNCTVNVGTPGATSLAVTQSTGLTVGVTPGIAGGSFSFTLRVTSDDTVNGTFDILVSGSASPGGAIELERSGMISFGGTDTQGGTLAGMLFGLTYTIRNTGTGTLTLDAVPASVLNATGCSITNLTQPGTLSLAPGATTTFTFDVTPDVAGGAYGFDVEVASNATNFAVFEFAFAETAGVNGVIQIERPSAILFGATDTQGGTLAGELFGLTYTIRNTGTGTLTLDAVPASVLNATGCNISNLTQPGVLVLAPGATTTFTFDVTPSVAGGAYGFDVEVASNATNYAVFEFDFAETAGVNGQIQLERTGVIAFNSTDSESGTVAGATFPLTYTIRNNGLGTLTLTGASPVSLSGQTNCAAVVFSQPAALTLAPGATTTFQLNVTPGVAGGAYSFSVSVASDAVNHAAFNFNFADTAALGGAIQITRGGPAFTNPGNDTASPATAGVLINLTYDIANTGTGTLSNIAAVQFGAATNCSVNVGTPGASSLAPGVPTTLVVGVTPGVAGGAFSFTLRVTSDDTVNGTFDIVVSGNAAVAGAIELERSGVIAYQDTDTQTGTLAGASFNLTYTIRNTGTGTLTLDAVPVSVFNATGCSITNLTQPGVLSLAPGATTTFSFDVTPAVAGGAYSFDVEVASNATNHAIFEFEFAETAGVNGVIQIERPSAISFGGTDGQGGTLAGVLFGLTYTIRNVGLGTLTLNAVPVSVLNATGCSITNLNQPGVLSLAPGATTTFSFDVTPFVAGGAYGFDVEVASNATNYTTFEFDFAETAGVNGNIELRRADTTLISHQGPDTQAGTLAGVSFNRVYTIRNDGPGTLTLATNPVTVSNAANCTATLQAQPSPLVLTPGATVNFTVEVTPAPAGGSYSYDVSVASDAVNHSVFEFTFTATAAASGGLLVERLAPIAHLGTDTVTGAVAGVAISPQLSYTLHNNGTGSVTVSAINILNPINIGIFAGPYSGTIGPGGQDTYTITAAGPVAAGAFSFDLEIISNDPANPTYIVFVSGVAASGGNMDIQRPASTSIAHNGNDTEAGLIAGFATTLTYTIQNFNGTSALDVGTVSAPGGSQSNCTVSITSQPTPGPLAINATTTFQVQVTPTVPGAYSFVLHAASDDPVKNPYVISFSATALAPAQIDAPPAAGFGSSNIGIGVPQTVQLDSIGGVDLVITSVQVIGAHAGDWAITSAVPQPGSVSVNPGSFFDVDLVFTPSALLGRTAQLEIISNHTGTPGTFTYVDLTGTGTTGDLTTNLTVNYPDTVATQTSPPVNHVLTNGGSGPARITAVSPLGGANPGAWQLTNLPSFPHTVASGGTYTIFGEFTPPGVGTYTAEFTVTWDNGPGTGPFTLTVQLDGDGISGLAVTGVVVAPDNGGPVEIEATVSGPSGSFIDVAVTYTGGLSPGPASVLSAGSLLVIGNVIHDVPANTQLVLFWNAYATEGHHSAADYVVTLTPSIGVNVGLPGSSAMFALNRQGGWTTNGPGGTALPFADHCMIHDEANNRLIMFGGSQASQLISVTWAFDLATETWHSLNIQGTVPPTRRWAAAAYDGPRNRMLMFGGSHPVLNDTWALDLTPGNESWTQIAQSSPATPNARHWSSLVVDAANDRAILFSGRSTNSGDVWILDLTTDLWGAAPVTIAGTGPGKLDGHAAVWDAVGNRMIVHGGWRQVHSRNVWELVLEPTPAWTLLSSTGPSARSYHAHALDTSRRSLVIMGTGAPADTWRFDLVTNTWEQLAFDPSSAAGRVYAKGAYDHVADRFVVHGGRNSTSTANYSDVVSLSLAGTPTWQTPLDAPDPAAGPTKRIGAVMAADQTSERVFVWGGRTDTVFHDELFQLDRTTGVWSVVNVGSPRPSARAHAAWTFDAVNNRVIVCGGEGPGGVRLMDVWSLSLSGTPVWTQWTTGTGPSPRLTHTIAYDDAASRLILFGGYDTATRDDLWFLEAGTWYQPLVFGPLPSARSSHGAVFDSVNNRMVMFHGTDVYTRTNTVFELDFNAASPTWNEFTPSGPWPSARAFFALAANATGSTAWLMHGQEGTFMQRDLWELDLSTPGAVSWTPIPTPVGPTERNTAAAALDAAGNLLVGYGHRSTQAGRDLWQLDLSAPADGWRSIGTGDAPRGVAFAYSALDEANNRMIVFGGSRDGRVVNELYALDLSTPGGAWQRLNPTGPQPGSRMAGTMVYDDGGVYPRMIMYGGRSHQGTGYTNGEVWELDLTLGAEAWTQLSTTFVGSTNNPGIRSWHTSIVDNARRMIVFGGTGSSDVRQNTTFALDLDTLVWTRVSTSGTLPDFRQYQGASYDNLGGGNRMIIFGGYRSTAFSDTWELDLNTNTWTMLTDTGIPPLMVHSQVLDPVKGRIVVFGGWDSTAQATAGMYEFDLATNTWSAINLGTLGPQHRYGHSAVWDVQRSRMVLMGGFTFGETTLTQSGGHEPSLWFWGD